MFNLFITNWFCLFLNENIATKDNSADTIKNTPIDFIKYESALKVSNKLIAPLLTVDQNENTLVSPAEITAPNNIYID